VNLLIEIINSIFLLCC